MIISAKFQVSILKTAPVMLRRNTAINKYTWIYSQPERNENWRKSISSELPFKKEGKFLTWRKLIYERNKRFLIMLGFYIALFQVLRTCPKRFTIIITPDRPIYPIRNLLNLPGGIQAVQPRRRSKLSILTISTTVYSRVPFTVG